MPFDSRKSASGLPPLQWEIHRNTAPFSSGPNSDTIHFVLKSYLFIIRLPPNHVALHAGSFSPYTLQGTTFECPVSAWYRQRRLLCVIPATSNNISNMVILRTQTILLTCKVTSYKVWTCGHYENLKCRRSTKANVHYLGRISCAVIPG